MSDKEKLYHRVNVVLIPLTFVSGIIFAISSIALDSASENVAYAIAPFTLLSMIIGIPGLLWIIISGLINENVRTMVIRGVKGVFKSFMGMVAATGWAVCLLAPFEMVLAFFIILIVFSLIALLWEIGLLILAIYLVSTSFKALKTNTSIFF